MGNYFEAIKPPYENDRLNMITIRDDFIADPALSYNRDRLIVIGGANLVLRGIVDYTPDIDLLAPKSFLELMTTKDGVEELDAPISAREAGATNKSIRFQTRFSRSWVCATDALGDGHYPMSFDMINAAQSGVEIVEGVQCLSLDHLVASKRALGREKDTAHLQAIRLFRAGDGEPF